MKTEYQEPIMEVVMLDKAPRTLIVESIGDGENVNACSGDGEVF